MEPVSASHIDSRPGKCGGKPCVAGTRIRVWDIHVWHDLQGRTAEQIVADFPQLTLSDVYAALAYYHDHRDAIQQEMKRADELVARMKAEQGPGLLDRLLGTAVHEDAIPSG
jgi:uncharacterized protein (DUF433 family)